MHFSNDVEPPQVVNGGSSPWDRQSRDDIAAGLHLVEQWEWPSTSATPYHRASGSVEGDATVDSTALPEWLFHYIMEIVAAQPDTTPEQRDQIAKKLLGCSCNGQHPPAPSGCIACRVGSASKSMFGSIRRTLSAAAKMRKRLRMPRKNSAGRQQAPQVAMPRWSDPLSPSSRPAGYGEPCNASTSENYPELPSDPLCELQGSDAGALFAGAMPSQGMFIPNTTQPTHMSYPSPPSQSHYQRSHSGHSAFSGRTADRSVSMMSDSSDAIRGTPSLFSRLSQSTVSSGLTAISTNNVPRFDNDKDLVDSPVGMEETGAAELPPWGLETGLPRQVSWNSTSTTVDPAWAGDQGAPEPAEWFRPVPPSTRDTFPITTNGILDSDGSALAPPPYSSVEMTSWPEPPAYSSPPQAQMAHGFRAPGNPRVFPDGSQAPCFQVPFHPAPVHHSMSFPLPPTPSQGRPQPFRKRNMPLRRTTTYGAITKQPSAAMRPNAFPARGFSLKPDTFSYPSFQPSTPSPDLPSVRRAMVQRPTSLRRRNNQPGPRPRRPGPKSPCVQMPPESLCEETPELTGCEICKYRPKAPQLDKKMRRHLETDGHRSKTNQPLVERMPCGFVGEDGVVCGKKFSRHDNLKQHQRLFHESPDAVPSEEEEDEEEEEDDAIPENDKLAGPDGEPNLEPLGGLASVDGLGDLEDVVQWEGDEGDGIPTEGHELAGLDGEPGLDRLGDLPTLDDPGDLDSFGDLDYSWSDENWEFLRTG